MSCIVMLGGRYAVKFHKNLCGEVYCVVPDHEATTFADEAEAVRTALRFRLERHHFTILPLPQTTGGLVPAGASPGGHSQPRVTGGKGDLSNNTKGTP